MGDDEQAVSPDLDQWVLDHYKRLSESFAKALSKMEREALRVRELCNKHAMDTSIPIGGRVLLRDHCNPKGNVYVIAPVGDLTKTKTVNWTELLDLNEVDEFAFPVTGEIEEPSDDNDPEYDSEESPDIDPLLLITAPAPAFEPDNEETAGEPIVPDVQETAGESINAEQPKQETIVSVDEPVLDDHDSITQEDLAPGTFSGPSSDGGTEVCSDIEVTENPSPEPPPSLRRSTRATRGIHQNPHKLPYSSSQRDISMDIDPRTTLANLTQAHLLLAQAMADPEQWMKR